MSLALDDQEGTGSPAALIESGLSACAANCGKDGGTTSSNPLSPSDESAPREIGAFERLADVAIRLSAAQLDLSLDKWTWPRARLRPVIAPIIDRLIDKWVRA